jgi:hypothetical protein
VNVSQALPPLPSSPVVDITGDDVDVEKQTHRPSVSTPTESRGHTPVSDEGPAVQTPRSSTKKPLPKKRLKIGTKTTKEDDSSSIETTEVHLLKEVRIFSFQKTFRL